MSRSYFWAPLEVADENRRTVRLAIGNARKVSGEALAGGAMARGLWDFENESIDTVSRSGIGRLMRDGNDFVAQIHDRGVWTLYAKGVLQGAMIVGHQETSGGFEIDAIKLTDAPLQPWQLGKGENSRSGAIEFFKSGGNVDTNVLKAIKFGSLHGHLEKVGECLRKADAHAENGNHALARQMVKTALTHHAKATDMLNFLWGPSGDSPIGMDDQNVEVGGGDTKAAKLGKGSFLENGSVSLAAQADLKTAFRKSITRQMLKPNFWPPHN